MLKLSSFLLLVFLIMSGCNTKSGNEESLGIIDAYAGDLLDFKDAYVGNASAVGNIVSRVESAEQFKGFELKTDEEPYGIILNYDGNDAEKNHKKTVVYNATFLFALIQNVDWVTFNFTNEEYTIMKEKLKSWYGEDFTEIQNEDEMKICIQKHLDDDKLNQLFR
ncbi:DUF4825 domain-containing protein [Paenibacillus polygoni]|uniref:DUF4825 domain-containing protein n=1 Tax=Paenibacillus polygoni TaxID=3050112 RepID=A0ABY8X9V5_9BACL|nr:DUF4825 domain-containing protein [Paenibacillus polygoni]WIV21479.1 DUF4825 domain-containing protein [Paenibacillus polygoni]